MPSNIYIAHEDRRVVVTQQPKASGIAIGEILIQGDPARSSNTAASVQL
jgi:hypothetical protein